MIEYFAKRKVTTITTFFLFILFGAIGLSKLKMELLPDVSFPTLTVVTVYSNVAPGEIETLVTKPIEEILASVGGIDRVVSESIEGVSIVTVRFRWGTNIDQALIQVREKLDLVKGSLPQDVRKSIVIRFDPNSAPVLQIAVRSKSIPLSDVRFFLRRNIIPYFERVDGIAAISLSGGFERQIQVNVDKGKLESFGIGMRDIVNQLNANNFGFPAGNVREGDKEIQIRTDGLFPSVNEIPRTVIGVSKAGIPIYLEYVAEIADSYKERTSISKILDEEVVSLILKKEAGKNTVQVSSQVRVLVAELTEKFGDKISFEIVSDQSLIIKDSIFSVASSGIIAIFICYFVLSFFLGNFREPAIVISAVPVSVMTTFLLMYGCGLTINTMSLGGLAIGVGMVVDSSTVVLEAISIRRKAGEDPVALSISGTKEVLTSIFGSTITSCVVFLPIVFVEGLAAEIFREFALTISFSLVSSFFTSSTLVPVLSQFEFFRPKGNDFPKIIEDFRLRSLDSIRSFFERISIFFYVKKSRTFLICIVLVPLTIFLGFLIPTEILPEIDQGELEFSVVTPEGSSLEYTVSVVDRIGAALRSESKVGLAFSKVGYEERDIVLNPQGDFGLNRASIFVRLDSGKTKDFLESFRPHIEKIESDSGAKISSKLSGGVLSTIFSNDGGISLEISGQDLQIIKDTAIHSEKLIRSIPGNPEVKSSLREESPELRVVLDREKMSFFGLTVEDIATALKSAYKGDIATKFRENDFEFDVLVRFREADRFGFRSVPAIPIRLQSGKSVLLGTLANIVPSNALRKITRMNGRRVAILSVSHPGISENKLEEGIADIAKSYVKKQDISVLPGELQKESAKSFAALYWAGAFAVLLIYMTLASQFENLILPLVVMLSVVMVGVGSLSLLILTKNTLSIISGMGMVMLTGLVVNNAIILIEFFMQGNASLDEEELLRSTVRRRIDTILNTTLTTVLGLLPAALSLGGDSPQEPMALAVIGGLTASTVLSVAIIPSAYFALRRSKK